MWIHNNTTQESIINIFYLIVQLIHISSLLKMKTDKFTDSITKSLYL